jgi:hypothetical protein
MVFDLGSLAILKNLKTFSDVKSHRAIILTVHLLIFGIQFYLIIDPYQRDSINKDKLYDLGFLKITNQSDLYLNSKYLLAQLASLLSFLVLNRDDISLKKAKLKIL